MINGPIPGESLTGEPKGHNWERPPQIVDPEEAILMHLSRLQDEDKMNIVLDALEFGEIDLYTLTQGIMRSAVANGVHTVDVGLIAAPLVHEFIKQTADAVGVEYDDGINIDKKREDAQSNRSALKARKKLKEMGVRPSESFDREEDEVVETLEEVVEEVTEEPKKPTKRGLGARPVKGEK